MTTVAIVGAAGTCARALRTILREHYPMVHVRLAARTAPPQTAHEQASGHVESQSADLFDAAALRTFVAGANVVINCVGPSRSVGTRVAQAALDVGAHYLDPGGYDELAERLQPLHAAFVQCHCSALIGCGWMPGLSGVFPLAIESLARQALGPLTEVAIYYGARDHWGKAAVADMAWAAFQPWSGFFAHGRWRKVVPFGGSRTVMLPEPWGKQRAFPWFDNQLRKHAQSRSYRHYGAYVVELGGRTGVVFALLRLLGRQDSPFWQRQIACAIGAVTDTAGPAGIVHVECLAQSSSQRVVGTLRSQQNHAMTGWCLAFALDYLTRGDLPPGCHHFCEVAPSMDCLVRLQKLTDVATVTLSPCLLVKDSSEHANHV